MIYDTTNQIEPMKENKLSPRWYRIRNGDTFSGWGKFSFERKRKSAAGEEEEEIAE